MMIDPVYAVVAVSVALVTLCLVALRKAGLKLNQVQKEKDDIVGEEKRMFDFLHHIGLAIEKDITPAQLYKEIVDGFRDVLSSNGAMIYLLSEDQTYLVPKYISPDCPVLVSVPEEIINRSKEDHRALNSYLMLSKVDAKEGLLGATIATGSSLHVANVRDHPASSHLIGRCDENLSAMIATLQYGGRNIGVVAVVRRYDQPLFSDNDFDVFRSISEQSAFALGNAMIHQEVSEKRKIDDELRAAREVQNVLLPAGEPHIPGYRVYGSNTPARMISGDYFDYIELPDERSGVVIADVTGKGLPAGLLMAMCRSVLRLTAKATASPTEALGLVNRHLFPDVREDMFVSLIYIVIDNNTGTLRMSRAGHDAPLMFRQGRGKVEIIKPPGLALGIDEGDVFDRVTKDIEIEMKPGDCLLLHTDGVCEAVDAHDNEFGPARMEQQFIKSAPMGAEHVVESIRDAVSEFAGDQPQMDDITLIAIEKK